MRFNWLAVFLGSLLIIIGCDVPMSSNSSGKDQTSKATKTGLRYTSGLATPSAVNNDTSKSSSSAINKVNSETQYELFGNFYISGTGSFSVTPPSTPDPGDRKWNTAPEAPAQIVSPQVQFTPTSITFEQSGSTLQQTLMDEFESQVNDAASDLEDANEAIEDEGLPGPGPEPVIQSPASAGQSAVESAIQQHAPSPDQAAKFFRQQGYQIKDLGGGRIQLRRKVRVHSGQTTIKHIYNVQKRRIERTRQYRGDRLVSEHRFESVNGKRRMVTTHYDQSGNPVTTSSMSPGGG